ncbi:Hsp20 family protein [Parvularcula marina]|uniref:Heat-shock protein n=1 Tax=Parvularcula marina TaxID=2292771 RepID=A0A371RLK1_9PROT|nr:Hsp20 family protein [Parvularcula marina]RFB06350.1 heat-shock protein [Parvularcula marina]
MRSYDLTPYLRSTVGFDRLFNDLVDNATKLETGGYPPYNIERTDENHYEITIAVAGFSEDDLELEVIDRDLRVTGRRPTEGDETREFLHQGIAGRNFDRRFRLAEHVHVAGAELKNGLLTISLEREIPEAKKPRKIEIGAKSEGPKVLKASNAA